MAGRCGAPRLSRPRRDARVGRTRPTWLAGSGLPTPSRRTFATGLLPSRHPGCACQQRRREGTGKPSRWNVEEGRGCASESYRRFAMNASSSLRLATPMSSHQTICSIARFGFLPVEIRISRQTFHGAGGRDLHAVVLVGKQMPAAEELLERAEEHLDDRSDHSSDPLSHSREPAAVLNSETRMNAHHGFMTSRRLPAPSRSVPAWRSRKSSGRSSRRHSRPCTAHSRITRFFRSALAGTAR
jgi:hypothetical protein